MATDNQLYTWYKDAVPTKVDWLWYPYIPFGKISVLQGDPGCGKSMLMIDIIAKATSGRVLPDNRVMEPINVIYQCSEDGIEDTIRPRLDNAGADCGKVAYITEELNNLTLDDVRIRLSIQEMNAKLLVIDPFQAYVGDSDLSNTIGMRRIMQKLGTWASSYNCAVVMVGHLNKKSNQKELYRGLGSVDIMAAARSVLQIDRIEDDSHLRIMKHVKSSLSSPGEDLAFEISSEGVFRWIPAETFSLIKQKHFQGWYSEEKNPESKIEIAGRMMLQFLSSGPKPAVEMERRIMESDIGERTIKNAKKKLGIVSYRKDGQWFWMLPEKTEPVSFPVS